LPKKARYYNILGYYGWFYLSLSSFANYAGMNFLSGKSADRIYEIFNESDNSYADKNNIRVITSSI